MLLHTAAGTVPSSLATSASATSLDVSSNQFTALPPEWLNGFANATQSSLQSILLQENQITVRVSSAEPQAAFSNLSSTHHAWSVVCCDALFAEPIESDDSSMASAESIPYSSCKLAATSHF